MSQPIRRRHLLGASAAVLSVAFLPGCSSLPVIPKRPAPDTRAGLGWIAHQNGRYRLTLPRVEMGQNIATALQQIACEELGIAPQDLALRLHDTGAIERVRATVGSESVADFALPLARACATLREALAAGQRQGELSPVEHPPQSLRTFAQQARWIGQSPTLAQGLELVTGRPLFASDVRLPGMRYGRVLRAPVPPEIPSAPLAMDETAARQVPGFVAVVRHPLLRMAGSEGVGIVAKTPAGLDRIEQALKIQWRIDGAADDQAIAQAVDIDLRLARQKRRHKTLRDDPIPDGPWDLDLRLDVPVAAHSAMEPRVAVAQPNGQGGLNLWVGSQDVFYQRDVICRRLGLDPAQVHVQGCRVGGAFGGKTICTVELEAAVLAHGLGQPVKVQWTRTQELVQAFHRPPSSHRIRARLQGGRLRHWRHDFASSHVLFTGAVVPAWMQAITDVIGDDGVARGAALPYRADAVQTGFDLVRLPVHTGPWRGLGAGPNGLAIESAMDECARIAGVDPVQFRLQHIEDPRLRRVLEAAVASAPSAPSAGSKERVGRGVACGIYKKNSYVAVVADVSVDPVSGSVRVRHLHAAHDCGKVINPDQVRAQCEGNLVWGLGMVLVESWSASAQNFGDAPIPRIGQLPTLSVEVVDHGEPPSGAGETAIVAAGAAIANAIRAATGWRPTRFPIRAEDVLAQLGART